MKLQVMILLLRKHSNKLSWIQSVVMQKSRWLIRILLHYVV
jgi:hypothetical protein